MSEYSVTQKRCGKCKEVKSIQDFSKYEITNKKHSSECKECHSKRLRDYYSKNIEKVRLRNMNYRKSEKGIESRKKCAKNKTVEQKRKMLLKRYNITLDQYNDLLINQNFVCKICKSKPLGKHLVVDHNHTTGEIRGLLCEKCNKALGFAKDDKNILQKMIEYLNKTLK